MTRNNPVAQALRRAGYKPFPRWWLTQEQIEPVEYMAKQNTADVNRIRNQIKEQSKWLNSSNRPTS